MEKRSIFKKYYWSNWMSVCRRMQVDPYISPCAKLKSKWIKDLHMEPDALNLIEEKVGNNLKHFDTGETFLNRTRMDQALRSTIDKLDFMKLKNFYKEKDTVNRTKW